MSKKPPIHVLFFVKDGFISSISMEAKLSEGMSWEMVGKFCPKMHQSISVWMNAYMAKQSPSPGSLPLLLSGTKSFSSSVLSKLERIPFGQSISYQGLAAMAGNAKASRAVGNACATNPFPLVIPCHRVLAKNNLLGGFSSGLHVKKHLLNFENISYS